MENDHQIDKGKQKGTLKYVRRRFLSLFRRRRCGAMDSTLDSRPSGRGALFKII